jgi:HSP20 family molecular chaperone IbpA
VGALHLRRPGYLQKTYFYDMLGTMKNNKSFLDLGTIFDEIFDAAEDFQNEIHRNFGQFGTGFDHNTGGFPHSAPFEDNIDYYPNYSYPPMNVYMTGDRSLVFEFALAGFDEKNLSLSFQGDYMVFSAKLDGDYTVRDVTPGCNAESPAPDGEENVRYFKRRLKLKDIEKQKYFVPLDKYSQGLVKAVYKNGILKVTVPPKADLEQNDGIRIEIQKEDV